MIINAVELFFSINVILFLKSDKMNKADESDEDEGPSFREMGLDDRLLEAAAVKLAWKEPTDIQKRAIPLIMEGRDLLARGRTGSGKTGAFVIPIIQKVLDCKRLGTGSGEQCVRALIMAPTKELCRQIQNVLKGNSLFLISSLTKHPEKWGYLQDNCIEIQLCMLSILDLVSSCGRVVRSVDVSDHRLGADIDAHKPLIVGDVPDIIVGTPSRVLMHIEAGHLDGLKDTLEILVLDEADLIISFGYEAEVKKVLTQLPSIYQSVLTSATLSSGAVKLKELVLRRPVTLNLEEDSLPEDSQLTQYQIKIEEEDKFVLIYALFKLKLVHGKTIVFVNSVDRCYKLKLYLEQFSIPVCVLNSELPNATRCHIVSQFNKGLYDVVVASDETFLDSMPLREANSDKKSKQFKVDKDKANSKREKDLESGASRGIDFQFVSNVINFDFPRDVDSYIHRVGRTARGTAKGTALNLVSMKEMDRVSKVVNTLKRSKQISSSTNEEDAVNEEEVFKPYRFRMEELDGFRYRATDAWRAVTKIAIREARLKEIKAEMLNSVKLKTHLADNPRDVQILRHDKALHTVRQQVHLRNVPDYIVPNALKKMTTGTFKSKNRGKRNFKKSQHREMSTAKKKFEKRQADPLRSLVSK